MSNDDPVIHRPPIQFSEMRPRKQSRSSFTLAITFLLGFLIGLATGYVLLRAMNQAPPYTEILHGPGPRAIDLAAPPSSMTPPSVRPSESTAGPAETARELTPDQVATAAQGLTSVAESWPGRHVFMAITGTTLDASTRDLLKEIKPGGIVLRPENIESQAQTAALIAEIKQAVGLGTGIADLPLIAVAEEGGNFNPLRISEAPTFAELGKGRQVKDAYRIGESYGTACVSRGIAVLLAPILDIADPAGPPDLAQRSFSNDSRVVTAMGLAFANGATAGGVLPVAKHYPGIGSVKPVSGKEPAILSRDISGVAQSMYPFSEAVNNGIAGMLVTHVAVPALDKDAPTRPASLSPRLVTDVIRDLWQFKGVILADDLAAPAIAGTNRAAGQATVEALTAGCDAALFLDPRADAVRAVCKAIEDATQANATFQETLSRSARRLDAWQTWLRQPTISGGAGLAALQTLADGAPAVAPQTPAESTAASPAETTPPATSVSEKVVEHTVGKGDSLTRIASRFGVSKKQLIEWNDLENDTIRLGQRLVVRVPEPVVPGTASVASSTDGVDAAPSTGAPELEEATSAAPTALPSEPTSVPEPAPVPVAPAVPVDSPAPSAPAPAVESVAAPPPAPTLPPAAETTSGVTPPTTVTKEGTSAAADKTEPAAAVAGTKKVKHRVAEGETLWRIARRYGVRPEDLRQWNDLHGDTVKLGQMLKIYAPSDPSNTPAQSVDRGVERTAQPQGTERVEHTIVQGDSLGSVAQQYGVNKKDLAAWNGLTSDVIKTGQKLVIYRPAPRSATPATASQGEAPPQPAPELEVAPPASS